MDPNILTQSWEQIGHEILAWIGFGTLTGLSVKALMPGRDPGGSIATMLMGITGCIVGCGVVMFFWPDARVTPISLRGFVAATAGAFLILLMYRVLAGNLIVEAEDNDGALHQARRRSRSRKLVS